MSSFDTVTIEAPSRLHFGLLSFGSEGLARQYGGVGLMLRQPCLRLNLCRSDSWQTAGPCAGRVQEFARRFAEFYREPLPNCRAIVLESPPAHVGLGSGTQLALSTAAALHAWRGRKLPSPAELAESVGRGLRSAVGTYGFVHGGLIVDPGKLPDEPAAPFADRYELPVSWRILLVRPEIEAGLSGAPEAKVFEQECMPADLSEQLENQLYKELLPAVQQGNFPAFSEAIFQYGRLAGLGFASRQQGPFNGPVLTQLVEQLRTLARGVGQSSWGPTLYAFAENPAAADYLAEKVRGFAFPVPLHVEITVPATTGVHIEALKL